MTTTPTSGAADLPEALKHAECLESFAEHLPAYGFDSKPLKEAAATIRRLHALLEAEDAAHCNTIEQRDEAEKLGTMLANAVAEHFRVEVGEYSNLNDPRLVALEILGGGYITDSDADRKIAALATGQAPAQAAPAYKDSTPELHVGDSAFESWYSSYNPTHKGDKQRARDAYAAGMGDPLVMAGPTAVAGPSGYGPKVTVKRRCSDCKACNSESYAVQGDSGHYVYCEHPSLPERKYIGDTHWDTPDWCPAAAPTTQPAPQQDVLAAGGDSFLLLPTRPTPDAPANTAGLSWDAYSGAQMLAYGRLCSDAALLVAREGGVA